MAIQIMLVDDHPIVRQGIKAVISGAADMRIIAEAADGKEAVDLAAEKSPEVVIMDITLPVLNGLDASSQILKKNKKTKILILSMHESHVFIEKALDCGIRGYVLKESAANEIIDAVREVYAGRYFLSSKISSFVIESYISGGKKNIPKSATGILTWRERGILQLIAEGLSNKEIANKLNIALKTVLVHRNNVMRKLNAHNQAQLIRYALKEGIISL
jgi:two-component system, NarL family, response regulator NreC